MKKLSITGIFLTIFFLLPVTSFPQIISTQSSERWCSPDSSYESVILGDAEGLRWSLDAISRWAKNKKIDKESKRFLPQIADASVFSLANVLRLRAGYHQHCNLEERIYREKILINENFMSILSSFSFRLLINSNLPLLFLEERQHQKLIKFDKKIEQRLKKWKKYKNGSQENTVTIAARLILGESIEWSERTLILPDDNEESFEFNLGSLFVNVRSTSTVYSWIEKLPVNLVFESLATYYYTYKPKDDPENPENRKNYRR